MPPQSMGQPSFMIDPMTGLPMAPMNPIQQAQTMFVQQQQQQRLMALKASIDSVLGNPAALTNPQIMQNLQDTMIQALEAPNATLQMAERARQSQQTAHFIQIMQGQIAQMLADPRVATNPALLQQLNSQMNQLRLLTMQHVAQQQIDANPATALSMPVLTSPSASMLNRAMRMPTATALNFDDSIVQGIPVASASRLATDENEDWWSGTPKAKSSSLSEKNPFRDADTETTPTNSRNGGSVRNLSRSLSNPNLLAAFNPMANGFAMGGQMPMSMPSMMQQQPMSMPSMMMQQPMSMASMMQPPTSLAMLYGSQQPGYNAQLANQQAMMNSMMMGGQFPRQF